MVQTAWEKAVAGGAGCGREAMSRAVRLMEAAIDGISPSQTLLDVPARWSCRAACPDLARPALPRFRSPRDKGIVPPSPDAASLDAAMAGRLLVFPAGFVLEPDDRRVPCLNVPRSGILSVVFYRDAFHAHLKTDHTVVVGTDAVDRVDSLFQACFWNPEA